MTWLAASRISLATGLIALACFLLPEPRKRLLRKWIAVYLREVQQLENLRHPDAPTH